MNNIDQLKQEVDEIKRGLDDLKSNVSLSKLEKKNKAEQLKNKAETAKQKLQSKIDALKDKTDGKSIAEREKAEALLNSFNDITNLYSSILSSVDNSTSQPPSQPLQDERNIFTKAKDWIGEQWEDVWDAGKWKRSSEGGKNILRTAGFLATGVGAVALTYKGLKKLWNRAFSSDDEEEGEAEETESKSKKKKKKKSFWDRWYGKTIKWGTIGSTIYYIAHGLSTGKWDLSHIFDWKHNGPTSTAEDNLDNYTELSHENPEKYREYEQIGENINLMYDQIWETEKNYFGANSQVVMGAIGDKAKEQKIKKNENFENIETRGLVPYSIDNFYSNVGDMLSYGGVNRYLRSKNIEEYQQKIMSFGADWFAKTMVPFLSSFANFASFGIVSSDSAQQKMDKYFKGIGDHSEENLEILDLFFRQYTKVLTYMSDKKNALALKYARDIIAINGYNGDSRPSDVKEQNEMLYEAINDSDWVENNLKSTKYGTFLSSSIVGAYKILKEEGLENAELTEELREVVKGVDEQTAKIIGGFDNNAFTVAESKLNNGQTLDANEKKELQKISKNLLDDLGNTTDGSRMYNTFDYAFELLGIEESDKLTILKESGLEKGLGETVKVINDLSSKIQANPTKENVEMLKNLVGEYTSMKKELSVALYAMKEAKENKDYNDYIGQFVGALVTAHKHFFGSVYNLFKGKFNLGDLANAFIGMTVVGMELKVGGKVFNCKGAYVSGQYMKKVGMFPITLAEMGLGQTRRSFPVKHRINEVAKSNPTKAENLMKKRILDGILTKKHVSSILQNNERMKASLKISGFQDNDRTFKEVVYNIFGDAYQREADLFIKYYGKANGLVHYSPESISNGGFTDGKFKLITDNEFKNGYKALGEFDAEFDKLGDTTQKSYFEKMLKKVKGADDMEVLNKFIKNDEFKKIITDANISKLKKLNISQLRMLEESGLLDELSSGTKNIDQVMEDLKKIEKMKISEARMKFRLDVDRAINKLKQGTANLDAVSYHIKQLKKLKYDTQLADNEMELFSKFIDKGFDAKIIPNIKKIFDIKEPFDSGEKIGEKLRKLFSDGNYSEVRRLLNSPSYTGKLESLGITKTMREGIMKNFDDVLHALGHNHITSEAATQTVKTIFKLINKVL